MLRTLADPGTPVTHETLSGMSPRRSAAYLRDLLMLHGVLPPADRNLALFDRWLDEALDRISEPGHRQVVGRFASWHVRRPRFPFLAAPAIYAASRVLPGERVT
jgi:hypothetical protein